MDLLKYKYNILWMLLLVLVTSCTSARYLSRAVFWNIPSTKDYKKFPKQAIQAAKQTFHFEPGTHAQEIWIEERLKKSFGVTDVDEYLRKMKTSAFMVITNDTLVYERYYNKHHRASIQTSFSVAKSITSLLIGKAIEEGKIDSIETPIVQYLPELNREPVFQKITIRNLLKMETGICHGFMLDALKAYYYPDLEKLIAKKIKPDPCKQDNWYNNYHTILLGLILERTTNTNISQYLEQHIWTKIGTEGAASWSTDKKGVALMTAGINARAIDFAKIGKLVLQEGKWEGQQLIQKEWLQQSFTDLNENVENYGYHWYQSYHNTPDYYAEGVWGQVLYISPSLNTIIIRHGKSRGKGIKQGNVKEELRWEIAGFPWSERIQLVATFLRRTNR